MQDTEWADLVAGARGRYADQAFDMGELYNAMQTLGLLDGEPGFDTFLDDARERPGLEELEDGRWRVTQETQTQEAPQEAQQEEAEAEVAVDRELVVERQGAGTWALWDSATGEWEAGGKETEAIAKARERGQQAADADGIVVRLKVVGRERRVKYTRYYRKGGKARGGGRAKVPQPDAPARPPLPGETPPAPASSHEPTPAVREPVPVEPGRTEDERAGGVAADGRDGSYLVVLRLASGGLSIAVDARHVVALTQGTDGDCFVALTGGQVERVEHEFMSLIGLIEQGRRG